MKVKTRKVGNSLTVTIPKELVARMRKADRKLA